jgi:hypothetical protein
MVSLDIKYTERIDLTALPYASPNTRSPILKVSTVPIVMESALLLFFQTCC